MEPVTKMICKFCGFTGAIKIKAIKSPYCNYCYSLYSCEKCKCRFFDIYEHNDISLNEIYEKLSEKYHKESGFKVSKYWSEQKNKIIDLYGESSFRILDVGCRYGDFLMHFPETCERYGIELSNFAANVAKKRGLKVINNEIEKIDNKQKYDVVTLYAVLEHLQEPILILNRLFKAVSEGGLLVVMIPTYESLKHTILDNFKVRWNMYTPPEHINFFSRNYLDEFFLKNGFYLVDRYFTSGGHHQIFNKIIFLNKIIPKMINTVFDHSFLNGIPVFDHMYSFYKKS